MALTFLNIKAVSKFRTGSSWVVCTLLPSCRLCPHYTRVSVSVSWGMQIGGNWTNMGRDSGFRKVVLHFGSFLIGGSIYKKHIFSFLVLVSFLASSTSTKNRWVLLKFLVPVFRFKALINSSQFGERQLNSDSDFLSWEGWLTAFYFLTPF